MDWLVTNPIRSSDRTSAAPDPYGCRRGWLLGLLRLGQMAAAQPSILTQSGPALKRALMPRSGPGHARAHRTSWASRGGLSLRAADLLTRPSNKRALSEANTNTMGGPGWWFFRRSKRASVSPTAETNKRACSTRVQVALRMIATLPVTQTGVLGFDAEVLACRDPRGASSAASGALIGP